MARNLLLPHSVSTVLRNYLDAEGRPICPVCGIVIGIPDAVARVDDCMIHLTCLEEARAQATPCDPSA
jgi:hypothetical protein